LLGSDNAFLFEKASFLGFFEFFLEMVFYFAVHFDGFFTKVIEIVVLILGIGFG
jgi:hypothetical protein